MSVDGSGDGVAPQRRVRPLVAHTDPVALVGITLSVTLSVMLDLSNAASGVESLLAGLMGITISLLVDSLARAERRFHLRTLLDGPPWLVRTTTELAGAMREAAEQHAGTRVAVEAQRRYEQFRLEAEQLAEGRIIRRGDEDEDLVGATRTCVRRLDALTNVMPRVSGELSWWRSEIGRRYWEANSGRPGTGGPDHPRLRLRQIDRRAVHPGREAAHGGGAGGSAAATVWSVRTCTSIWHSGTGRAVGRPT